MLVSIQVKTLTMELHDSKPELISSSSRKEIKSKFSQNKDIILCNHCKRTSSNGIRCLGICVGDNDY